jgi:hypothetical protein
MQQNGVFYIVGSLHVSDNSNEPDKADKTYMTHCGKQELFWYAQYQRNTDSLG